MTASVEIPPDHPPCADQLQRLFIEKKRKERNKRREGSRRRGNVPMAEPSSDRPPEGEERTPPGPGLRGLREPGAGGAGTLGPGRSGARPAPGGGDPPSAGVGPGAGEGRGARVVSRPPDLPPPHSRSRARPPLPERAAPFGGVPAPAVPPRLPPPRAPRSPAFLAVRDTAAVQGYRLSSRCLAKS